MKLIDCHAHAYQAGDVESLLAKLAFLDGALAKDDPNRWILSHDGRLASLVAEEAEAGIGRFVLLPVATKISRVAELNLWTARAAERFKAIIPFGTLHPLSENPAAELAQVLELGFKGIKLHSLLQRFDLLQEESINLLEAIAQAGLPVLLDTLYGPGLLANKPHLISFNDQLGPFGTDPKQIAELAQRVPNLRIIAAHLGCLYGWEQVEPLFELENVWIDLSYVDRLVPPVEAVRIVRAKGIERCLWGTDAPWRKVAPARDWFLNLDLSQGEKEMIGAGNLVELLEL